MVEPVALPVPLFLFSLSLTLLLSHSLTLLLSYSLTLLLSCSLSLSHSLTHSCLDDGVMSDTNRDCDNARSLRASRRDVTRSEPNGPTTGAVGVGDDAAAGGGGIAVGLTVVMVEPSLHHAHEEQRACEADHYHRGGRRHHQSQSPGIDGGAHTREATASCTVQDFRALFQHVDVHRPDAFAFLKAQTPRPCTMRAAACCCW